MTSSGPVRLGWEVWSRGRGTSGKSAQMPSCRYYEPSVSSVCPDHRRQSFHSSDPLQMARAFFTQHHNRQHSTSYASIPYTPSSYLQLRLPMVLSTVQQHQRATHFRSYTSLIHSTVTASSFPQVGTVGERSRCCAMALTRKRGARRGSRTSRQSLASMEGVEQVHGNSMRRSYRTRAQRHVPFIYVFFPFVHRD
jgi:hypothetical protein